MRMNDIIFAKAVSDEMKQFCIFGGIFLDLRGDRVAACEHGE